MPSVQNYIASYVNNASDPAEPAENKIIKNIQNMIGYAFRSGTSSTLAYGMGNKFLSVFKAEKNTMLLDQTVNIIDAVLNPGIEIAADVTQISAPIIYRNRELIRQHAPAAWNLIKEPLIESLKELTKNGIVASISYNACNCAILYALNCADIPVPPFFVTEFMAFSVDYFVQPYFTKAIDFTTNALSNKVKSAFNWIKGITNKTQALEKNTLIALSSPEDALVQKHNIAAFKTQYKHMAQQD